MEHFDNLNSEQTSAPNPIPVGKQETLLAPALIILSLCLVECIFYHLSTLFMTLAVAGTLVAGRIYLRAQGFRFQKSHNILFGILIFFSLAYSLTANSFLCTLVTLFEGGGFCFLYYLVSCGAAVSDFCIPFMLKQAVIQFPFSNMPILGHALNEGLNQTARTKNLKYAVLGLLITIPLTLVVAALLMSADDGVAEILNSLIGSLFPNLLRLSWRLILAVLLSCLLLSVLYTCARERGVIRVNDEECERRLSKRRIAPSILLCAGVLPVCILYCIFIYSQAGYLFAAFSHRLPEGFSYAQYARQGFFELCALSVINLAIIIALQLLAKENERRSISIRVMSLILCAFTLFILATAFRKMVLYIERFGLTPLRFYTSWFMVLLTVLFILLIIWICRRSVPIFRNTLIIFTIWFALLVFSRPDYVIARYNYQMYEQHQLSSIDYMTLSELSDDAWSYLGAQEEVPETYRQVYLRKLTDGHDYYFNLSSLLAYYSVKNAKE